MSQIIIHTNREGIPTPHLTCDRCGCDIYGPDDGVLAWNSSSPGASKAAIICKQDECKKVAYFGGPADDPAFSMKIGTFLGHLNGNMVNDINYRKEASEALKSEDF